MRFIYLPAIIILLAGVLGQAPGAGSQSGDVRSRSAESLDLNFPSGTAMDCVTAIRKFSGDTNIVVTDDLRDIRVNEVVLRNVTVASALEVIDGSHHLADGRTINVDIDVRRDSPSTQPIYLVRSRTAGRQVVTQMSRVWSLVEPLAGPYTADQVLTAIEAALALYGAQYPAADLRFHEETMLLISRGHPEQIETIAAVLTELATPARKADDDPAAAAAREEITQLHRQMVEWQTRAELYDQENDKLRGRLARTEDELQRRAVQLRDLEAEVQRLREVVKGSREN